MIKDRIIWSLFGGSVLVLIFSGIAVSLGIPLDTGPLIIRFDNYHNQVALTGGLSTIGIVFGFMAILLAINLFLAHQIYDRDKFLSYMLGLGSLVVSVFFLFATVAISLFN